MFKFWKSKKEKDERKNASEVDPEKATVDVDGERVPLKILVDTWKAEEAEIAKKAELARQEAEANTVKEDTVVEIDGKEIAVKSMMDSHRRRKASEAENAKLKAENEAKAKAEAEAEAEAAKKKAAADNENDATCEGCKNRCHSAEMVKHNGKSLCAECAKKARAENEAEAEAAKKAKAENDLKAEAEAKKKAENEAEEKRKNFEALQKAANDRNGITPPPALTTRKELAEEGAKRYGSAKK